MAITITIAAASHTAYLRAGSLSISDTLNARNTCRFTLIVPTIATLPAIGAEVVISNGATVVFSGTLDNTTATHLAPPNAAIAVECECVDHNTLADRRLVAEVYETPGQTLGDIVRNLVATYLAGFGVTDTEVQDGPVIERAVFNYQTVADVFNELAELTGYSWNIDYSKVLHFFARETNYSPYDLTVTSANWRDMVVSRERSQYRNKQLVRAGTDLTDAQTDPFVGDGTRKIFVVKYPVASEPTITVATVAKTVGIRGLETGFDWYWNKGSNELSQDDGAPAVGAGVAISAVYTGMQPIMLSAQDDAAIAADGIWEAIEDRPNVDQEALAVDIANGLLRKLGSVPVVVEWETDTDGLEAGQLVTITIPALGLSGRYLIESVQLADLNGARLRYRVKALDSETQGGWEEFFRNVLRVGRKFVIRDNEVLLLLRTFSETVTLTDAASYTTATAAASKWVVGTSVLGFFEI
jgi:hypothetical protein